MLNTQYGQLLTPRDTLLNVSMDGYHFKSDYIAANHLDGTYCSIQPQSSNIVYGLLYDTLYIENSSFEKKWCKIIIEIYY